MTTELDPHNNPEKPVDSTMIGDKHSSSGDITAEGASATTGHAKAVDGEMYDFSDPEHLKKVQRSLVWKMDLQVVTMALAIYFLSFLDRSNIGQARLNGLVTDLFRPAEANYDYQLAITCLYVPYIIFEVPSNLLIKKVTPAIWLPGLLTAWGIVSTLQGIVTSRTGLFVNRAFLGFAEAGVLPGISLWLTLFYKPEEIMLRQAIYFSGASLSGAFSGLLSVAIGKMGGISGLSGWQWIFILEGIFTVLVGVFLFFVLPSGPANLFWLTPEERQLALTRLDPFFGKKEAQDEEPYAEKFKWSEVGRAFLDPRNILFAISGFCVACGLYGFAFFAPTIIKGLNPGYSNIQAQLLSCPPFAVAFVLSIVLALISDRLKWRFPVAIFSYLLCIIGFAVAIGSPISNSNVRYGSLIIAAAGLYTVPVSTLSWVSTINASHYKKATAIAFYIIFTNSGGLASTFTWYDAPSYRVGFITNLVLNIVGLLCIVALELLIIRDNKRKEQGKNDHYVEALREKGYGPRRIWIELGDRHPDFKPML